MDNVEANCMNKTELAWYWSIAKLILLMQGILGVVYAMHCGTDCIHGV
jgi:hypothetical protein